MTRLVVHIGAAKTATTYIQHSLYDNKDILAKEGVYLPRTGRFSFTDKTILHHNLAWQLQAPARYNPAGGGWDDLVTELRGVEADVVLLTSESFERSTYSKAGRQAFQARLREVSDDITILYVVRDQLSYMNSLYNQNVKSFRIIETFEQWAERVMTTDQLNLDKRFKPWYASDKLRFVAVPFDALVSGNLLQNFLKAADIQIPDDRLSEPRPVSNESLGPIGVEAARLLGGYLRILDPSFDFRADVALKAYRVAARKARENGWCSESFWGWSPELAQKVATREQASNERFAAAVLGPDKRLSLPVDRPNKSIRLIDVTPEEQTLVHRFVGSMSRRYVNLKSGRGPGKGGSVSDEDDADDFD